jgi:hypothetical protein
MYSELLWLVEDLLVHFFSPTLYGICMLHTLFLSNKNEMGLASKLAERLTEDDTEYRRVLSGLSPPIPKPLSISFLPPF